MFNRINHRRSTTMSSLTEQLIHQNLSIYFQQRHGAPIFNFQVLHLRQRYILTGSIVTNGIRLVRRREVVSDTAPFLTRRPRRPRSTTPSVLTIVLPQEAFDESLTDVTLARCTNCDDIGIIGNLCNNSDCEDSGNIFADPLLPAQTEVFDQAHFESTGEYRT